MFTGKIKKFRIACVLFAVFSNYAIFAGNILLTPLNYNTSGLFSTTSGGTFNPAGFSATGSAVFWTITGYNIRNGQSWSNLSINATSTGGSYDLYIYSQSQVVLYSKTASTTSISVDLASISALNQGAPFYIRIVLNLNLTINSINVSYAGNQIVCYPSPYQISAGNMKIVFDVNTSSTATLQIYDNRGRLVKTILTDKAVSALASRYDNILTWDGKDDNGRIINTGVYMVVVRVNPVNAANTTDKYISTFRVLVVR